MRIRTFTTVSCAVAALALTAAGASSAQASTVTPRAVTPRAGTPITGTPGNGPGTVETFGFNGHTSFATKPVVVSDRSAAAKLAARAVPDTGSFICSLYVGGTHLTGGDLEAGTVETCTGDFDYQYTRAQWAENAGSGFFIINGTDIAGPVVHGEVNDTDFYLLGCNLDAYAHPYQLQARGYAVATNGVLVSGYLEYGGSNNVPCL